MKKERIVFKLFSKLTQMIGVLTYLLLHVSFMLKLGMRGDPHDPLLLWTTLNLIVEWPLVRIQFQGVHFQQGNETNNPINIREPLISRDS